MAKEMKIHKVLIVGREGTTGLRIAERLSERDDIELLGIADDMRKDLSEIVRVAEHADILILCLPDEAAKDVVSATKHFTCRIIDASTAHRSDADWAYGFPELGVDYRRNIASGRYVAVPGCHASGMISILKPLIDAGVLPPEYPVSVLSLTGYSGGGKSMIADYESEDKAGELFAPRQYGLGQHHKHMKEVVHVSGLARPPIFMPVVDDYYSGMEVSIGFQTALLALGGESGAVEKVKKIFREAYADAAAVKVSDATADEVDAMFMSAGAKSGTDDLTIYVSGNDERVAVHALLDNLGKGASGAAVQCLNIMIGSEEATSLVIS